MTDDRKRYCVGHLLIVKCWALQGYVLSPRADAKLTDYGHHSEHITPLSECRRTPHLNGPTVVLVQEGKCSEYIHTCSVVHSPFSKDP
jgi:hypothetical protein